MVRAMSAARFLLAVAATAALAHPARAGTDTDVLTVTATVLSACSLSGGHPQLRHLHLRPDQQPRRQRHDQLRQLPRHADLRARWRRQRQHQRPADAQRRQPPELPALPQPAADRDLGHGADAQVHILLGTQSGSVTVYGRIPGGQVVPDGTYTDTVNITLTF